MNEIKAKELIDSVRKFQNEKKEALDQVNRELYEMENYSDDEFEIL